MFVILDAEFDYVITLSDHGELLGERGGWKHLSGVDPELTHVPLVVSGPRLDGSTDEVVSLLDVHTTVTELAGCEPLDGQRGTNLLDEGGTKVDPAGVLTKYHGLTEGHREGLVEDGFDPNPLLEERFGVAVPRDYYGYETGDEWLE